MSRTWTYLLGADRLQSVILSRGVAHRASSYDPFGCQASALGGIAFNGQLPEVHTGHYLLGHGHRAYSTVLRRFTRADASSPFGAGWLNAYVYCEGDPVNASDPTGRSKRRMGLAGMLGVGGLAAIGVGVPRIASPKNDIKKEQTGENSFVITETADAAGWFLLVIGIGLVVGAGSIGWSLRGRKPSVGRDPSRLNAIVLQPVQQPLPAASSPITITLSPPGSGIPGPSSSIVAPNALSPRFPRKVSARANIEDPSLLHQYWKPTSNSVGPSDTVRNAFVRR